MGAELPELRKKGEALDRFTERFLALPGIPGHLSGLQDRHGADRALVLILAWVAAGPYRPLERQAIDQLAHVSRAWQADLIQPLERLRNTLGNLEMREAREVRRSLAVSENQAEKASRFALLRRLLPLVPAPAAEPSENFTAMMRCYQDNLPGEAFPETVLRAMAEGIRKATMP